MQPRDSLAVAATASANRPLRTYNHGHVRLREILPRNRARVSRLPTGAERLLICGFGFLLHSTTKVHANARSAMVGRFALWNPFTDFRHGDRKSVILDLNTAPFGESASAPHCLGVFSCPYHSRRRQPSSTPIPARFKPRGHSIGNSSSSSRLSRWPHDDIGLMRFIRCWQIHSSRKARAWRC